MHDRRIDGEAQTFANYGGLYMNAMTWLSRESDSVWSQATGVAIQGPLKGVRLEMLPSTVVPWGTWKKEHADTLVLKTSKPLFRLSPSEPFRSYAGSYVIGVALGEHAKAYPFDEVSERVVVNDAVGEVPVLVYANPDDRSVHIFVRRAGDLALEFQWSDGRLVDAGTGSVWDPTKGFALEGPLRGELLKELPSSTAYDWAWEDFYPHTQFYRGGPEA